MCEYEVDKEFVIRTKRFVVVRWRLTLVVAPSQDPPDGHNRDEYHDGDECCSGCG